MGLKIGGELWDKANAVAVRTGRDVVDVWKEEMRQGLSASRRLLAPASQGPGLRESCKQQPGTKRPPITSGRVGGLPVSLPLEVGPSRFPSNEPVIDPGIGPAVQITPVSPKMNSPKYNEPDCIESLTAPAFPLDQDRSSQSDNNSFQDNRSCACSAAPAAGRNSA